MSILIPEKDLPVQLTVEQAVEAAYAAELAEVASKLQRGLPALVECDKDLAPYIFINVRSRLKAVNLRCLYLDGRPRGDEQPQAGAMQAEREARSYADAGPHASKLKKELKDQLRGDLEKQAKEREDELQKQATDRLEAELGDLRSELDQDVNRVTAEALKQ